MSRQHVTRRNSALVVALAGFGAVTLAGRQQTTFRASVNSVPIYATVRDGGGRLVTNLTQQDFSVFDNGKAQPLTSFSSEIQPVSIVVMLDRSVSMAQRFEQTRLGVEQFIGKLLPADEARIGTFGLEIRIRPDEFTGDHNVLRVALGEALQEVGASPVWTAVDKSLAALSNARSRRVVLLFSDGYNAPAFNQFRADISDVLRRAERDEAMVYVIAVAGQNVQTTPGILGRSQFAVPTVEPPHPDLKKIADQTGGGYIELAKKEDLAARFAEVAEELHRQYLLGFSAEKLDGKTHKLDVKIGKSGLTVRARKSYVAKTAKQSP
jgi:VWFA-related protein